MNDGGRAEGKTDEPNHSIGQPCAGSYSWAIARTAVAQICETVGFEGFNDSALDSLADIVVRYIRDLGKISKFYANLAGRIESNVFDVAQGLEDLGLPQGLSAAMDIHIHTDCKVGSCAITEIKHYIETSQEVPFAQPVQKFPVIREGKAIRSFSQVDEFPSFKHIPPWLPAFPDPHTYIRTPVWNERISDPRADKIELARQQRKAERSLLSLQQRVLCNGQSSSSVPEPSESDDGKMGDPFFVNPLHAGEKQISLVKKAFAPAIESMRDGLESGSDGEKHVSLVETFAPAIESMKDGLDWGNDGGKIVVPEKRAISVFLELKKGKKVFGEPLDLRIRHKAESWFGREDERDDKKRRVEFILRQSLENQQELPQL
ncbi:Transcription initiation factor TFIID subunit 8 [Striga hermonthica]|uniref:Transcription initiation factor TFIID subunit 8 n=1 Tax=Striga hermonthica TaxID=68872 RepID=A0A9N7P245_STRHE|nr:Transcription initiation factor TFIID subunit 8 [Striga hermonthica]